MLPVISRVAMRELEQRAIQEVGISEAILMENAAYQVLMQLIRLWYQQQQKSENSLLRNLELPLAGVSLLVCCGSGNNGGDGAAIARLCLAAGAEVTLVFTGSLVKKNTRPSQMNVRAFYRLAPKSFYAFRDNHTSSQSLQKLENQNWHFIVDAVYGIGYQNRVNSKGNANTELIAFIKRIKERKKSTLVVSVDIPSGLDCDQPYIVYDCVVADVTVCFATFKPANIFYPAAKKNGHCVVVPIGFPKNLYKNKNCYAYVITSKSVKKFLKQTMPCENSTKRTRGIVNIIAGSNQYPGAAILVANSCYTMGAGMVHLALPKTIVASLRSMLLAEIIVHEYNSSNKKNDLMPELFLRAMQHCHVLAVGCGVDVKSPLKEWFINLLTTYEGVVVLDADALNWLAPLQLASVKSPHLKLILTPHLREFYRLIGREISPENIIVEAQAFAKKHEVILLLKDQTSLVVNSDGQVAILPFAVTSVGRAGSGDVLTGILASLLAQFLGETHQSGQDLLWRATAASLYVSATMANLAKKEIGSRYVRPDDLRNYALQACKMIMQPEG